MWRFYSAENKGEKMKTVKIWNPTTWFSSVEEDTPQTSTEIATPQPSSTVITDERGREDATIVAGTFVPNGADELFTESSRQTEHFAKVVEQFDEDKQESIEWVIWKAASWFCYIAPFALAVPIGLGVGDVFTTPLPGQPVSPLMRTGSANIGIHMLSLFLELLMPILGLTTVLVFKRALKSRPAIAGFIYVGAFFLTVSVGNALALFFLIEKGTGWAADGMTTVVTLGRSFGPLILDVGAATVLSFYAKKSLDKYLADKQTKIEATKRVNDIHIAMEQTKIKTSMDRQQAVMDMHSKQQRANTWNELEMIQSQAMIEQARQRMRGDDSGDGYRRSRY